MDGMWAGYIWGENASWTVRWEPPHLTFADASLHLYEAPLDRRNRAVAWVRSVAVRDPSTGLISEKPSPATVPLRIEENAVAVTYGLNTAFR